MKFLKRQQRDEELDAEIRTYLDQAIRDRIARGEAPDEARANALSSPAIAVSDTY
jgi:hypothetical protein